jgi:hypothetical protein
MPYASTDRLAALIDRKYACLAQLRELGERQMTLADGGDMGELLKVLSAKQHLIHLLQGLEAEMEPYRHDDPDQRRWRSPADRARCAEVADRCQQVLDEVLAQEKQSEARLAARRDEVARQLKGAGNAQQARHAYARQAGPKAGMLDLSSDA